MRKDHTIPMLLLAVLLTAGGAVAVPIVPADINPGETYHLVFVSSTARDATSRVIADYDALVQVAADATGLYMGSLWQAIGSTATINAVDQGPVDDPRYNSDGLLVAVNEADLFAAVRVNPINRAEGFVEGGGGGQSGEVCGRAGIHG